MNETLKDDVFYVCTMIEYCARKTHNHHADIVRFLDKCGIARELKNAQVNHCLTFEEVCGEWIDNYHITCGEFDYISKCRRSIPSETSIGRLYQILVFYEIKNDDIVQTMMDIFSSFICDYISNFNSALYYANPDYLRCCYEDGEILD